MQTPVQLTYRHLPSSPALDAHVRKRVEKLERFDGRIVSCRIAIEAPSKHTHHGGQYKVHIDIGVPGASIAVSRSHEDDVSKTNPYAAVDAAFTEVERQLVELGRKRRQS